jgi:hypothetical protein
MSDSASTLAEKANDDLADGISIVRIQLWDTRSNPMIPAAPLWRLVINGWAADFPTEGLARGFAAQIVAVREAL